MVQFRPVRPCGRGGRHRNGEKGGHGGDHRPFRRECGRVRRFADRMQGARSVRRYSRPLRRHARGAHGGVPAGPVHPGGGGRGGRLFRFRRGGRVRRRGGEHPLQKGGQGHRHRNGDGRHREHRVRFKGIHLHGRILCGTFVRAGYIYVRLYGGRRGRALLRRAAFGCVERSRRRDLFAGRRARIPRRGVLYRRHEQERRESHRPRQNIRRAGRFRDLHGRRAAQRGGDRVPERGRALRFDRVAEPCGVYFRFAAGPYRYLRVYGGRPAGGFRRKRHPSLQKGRQGHRDRGNKERRRRNDGAGQLYRQLSEGAGGRRGAHAGGDGGSVRYHARPCVRFAERRHRRAALRRIYGRHVYRYGGRGRRFGRRGRPRHPAQRRQRRRDRACGKGGRRRLGAAGAHLQRPGGGQHRAFAAGRVRHERQRIRGHRHRFPGGRACGQGVPLYGGRRRARRIRRTADLRKGRHGRLHRDGQDRVCRRGDREPDGGRLPRRGVERRAQRHPAFHLRRIGRRRLHAHAGRQPRGGRGAVYRGEYRRKPDVCARNGLFAR